MKMYPGFSSMLNLSIDDLPTGDFIVIEDNQTDGSFMIHHFLSLFVKGGGNVFLVGFAQTLVHYSTIAKKLGLNVNAAKEKGQLVFFDGMDLFLELLEPKNGDGTCPIDMKQFYLKLKSALSAQNAERPALLILDNISMLLNAGYDANAVSDFMHYCYSLAQSPKNKTCLLALLHCDTDIDDNEAVYLRNQLRYQSTIDICVRGLETGYSRDVHGQIEVTKKHNDMHISPETKIMQYKLTDKGVDFFPPGTSAAVL